MNKILIIEDDITINGLLQSIIEKTDILLTMRTMEQMGLLWRSKGSGIGLYICRQFIEAMGGSIRAEINGKILSIIVTLNSALVEN